MSTEELINQGWKKYYECNCSGGIKQYFKNEQFNGFEVLIKPKNQVFRLLKNNHLVAGPDWLYKLPATMQEYGIWSPKETV
ncbi:hypothetical protein QTN47_17010 [Danxiaibacter flavus]|uniref:Uncharacterized protein n=1 Tax=Danxiaibacter flavus TaxID=3049108 RepID=A0ABV3ZH83_9BACT|nr:hypothetical protein QNM32_17020 [Chitinophagaceae bacterium DXS]